MLLFQFRFVRNRQFLTTLFTTAGQYLTAIGSLHTLTKTMHGLAATSVRLKCTFHLINVFYVTGISIKDHRSPYPLSVKGTAKLGKKRLPANKKTIYW